MNTIYKKELDINVSGNVVYIYVSNNKKRLFQSKKEIQKYTIKYTTCDSKICQYKKDLNCPLASYGLYGWCVCPHGQTHSIVQPRRGTKKYDTFRNNVTLFNIRKCFGIYSDWVYNNIDYDLTANEYNDIKDLKEFQIKNMTNYWKSNHEFLKEISDKSDKDEINSYVKGKLKTPRFCGQLCRSFIKHLLNEYNMNDNKLSKIDKERIEFENKNNLFLICGEYLFMDIPWLRTNSFIYKDIFKYEHTGGFSGHNFNLIKLSNVIKYEKELYEYLISETPQALMGGEITDYQTLYVPLIKKIWSSVIKEIKGI